MLPKLPRDVDSVRSPAVLEDHEGPEETAAVQEAAGSAIAAALEDAVDKQKHAALQQRIAARSQRALWIAMIVGVVFGGAAFAYKIVEFLFTLSAPEARGFAEVPIAVYFCVAGGWMCLLAWCFASGQFKNLEQAKFEMLEMEEEYERRGI